MAAKWFARKQEKRIGWMFQDREEPGPGAGIKFDKNEYPVPDVPPEPKIKKKQIPVPEVHSDLEETEIGKEISYGFRSFVIREKLATLTKVEDERGLLRWGVLEKNDIELYCDF